ncbi:MAG: hypothetical protein SFW09_21075 [Hyphomicrobiaceae bacterium]|nr:hypothetical protein [Hyphomicrobiaceae bacterium]
MTLSPRVFLRAGFVILGLSTAFAVWTGTNDLFGWWLALAGVAAFAVVTGIGEAIVQRAARSATHTAAPGDCGRRPPG